MGVLTGMSAAISGISRLQEFWIEAETIPEGGYDSASPSGPVYAEGNEDWRGQAQAYGGEPAKLPGTDFTFVGCDRNFTGATGPAIVDSTTIHWLVEEGNCLYHVYEFSGDGKLNLGAATAGDTGTPLRVPAKGMGLKLGSTFYCVRRMQLRLRRGNAPYNDSCTAGYTKREPGVYHADFSALMYYDDVADIPARGLYGTTLMTAAGSTASTGWALNYCRIWYVKPTIVIRSDENGQSVYNAAEVRGVWQAFSGATSGAVTAPSGAQWWPPTA